MPAPPFLLLLVLCLWGPDQGTASKSPSLFPEMKRRTCLGQPRSVLALRDTSHDWALSVSMDGKLVGLVDAATVFEDPHFHAPQVPKTNLSQSEKRLSVMEHLLAHLDRSLLSHNLPRLPATYDVGVDIEHRTLLGTRDARAKGKKKHTERSSLFSLYRARLPASCYQAVNHHQSHALYAFYDSPFNQALVFTLDGGGNDGHYNVYIGDRGPTALPLRTPRRLPATMSQPGPSSTMRSALSPLLREERDLGGIYLFCSQLWPPLASKEAKSPTMPPSSGSYSSPAVLMDASTHGRARPHWLPILHQAMSKFVPVYNPKVQRALAEVLKHVAEEVKTLEDYQDWAATVQYWLQEFVIRKIGLYLSKAPPQTEGVALAGGVAQNALLVSAVARHFAPRYRVHVPCAPGDEGLALGMLYHARPPAGHQEPVRHMGTWASDPPEGGPGPDAYRPRPADLARLLASGLRLGVVRGRAAVGPYPLGVRSVLVAPANATQLERAFGQPRYPIPILVAEAHLPQVTDERFTTGCVGFAPLLTERLRRDYPTLADGRGYGRVFVVGLADNAWLHSVLQQVQSKTQLPFLAEQAFTDRSQAAHYTGVASLIRNQGQALRSLARGDVDAVLFNDVLHGPLPATGGTGPAGGKVKVGAPHKLHSMSTWMLLQLSQIKQRIAAKYWNVSSTYLTSGG